MCTCAHVCIHRHTRTQRLFRGSQGCLSHFGRAGLVQCSDQRGLREVLFGDRQTNHQVKYTIVSVTHTLLYPYYTCVSPGPALDHLLLKLEPVLHWALYATFSHTAKAVLK